MNEQDKNRFIDMLKSAKRARTFLEGRSRPDLETNEEMIGFAVVRAVEIIGKAASKITEIRLNAPSFSYGDVEAGGVYG